MGDRFIDGDTSVEEIRQYALDFRTHFENGDNKILIETLDKMQFYGNNNLDFYKGLINGLGFQREMEVHLHIAAGHVLQPIFDVIRGYYANKMEELGVLGELEKAVSK